MPARPHLLDRDGGRADGRRRIGRTAVVSASRKPPVGGPGLSAAGSWGTRTGCARPSARWPPASRTPGRAVRCAGRRSARPRARGRPLRRRSAGRVVTMRPVAQAGPHQGHQVGHSASHSSRLTVAARPVRVDAGPEQHLGPIDVADPGEHGLVHQQQADRTPAAADAAPGDGLLRVARAAGPGRGGPAPRPLSAAVQTSHGGGAAQVGVRPVGDQPHPHGARAGPAPASAPNVHLPIEPEVHVQQPVAGEAQQQVLAVGVRPLEPPAVEQRRALGEAALRAGDRARAGPRSARRARAPGGGWCDPRAPGQPARGARWSPVTPTSGRPARPRCRGSPATSGRSAR